MIVNYTKKNAGVLVMPCMKNNLIVKQIYIVPGHNEIDDADWLMARPSAKRYLDKGYLEAFEKEVEPTSKKGDSEGNTSDRRVDLLTLKTFPYNDVVAVLKEIELYDALCEAKKEDMGKATLSKQWLVDYLSTEEEIWDKVIASLVADEDDEDDDDEEIVAEITSIKLSEMESQAATDVILDTYNMETLEKWKETISSPDLRVLILNQIEEVLKPNPKKGARK